MTEALHHSWRPSRFLWMSAVVHLVLLVSVVLQPGFWPWALAIFLANHLLITGLGLWPRSHWLGPNWTRLPGPARDRNQIALTIDDGPDPAVTPQVLDILDRFQVRASFFCIGQRAVQHPGLCREIVARGHAVENHTMAHPHHFSVLGIAGLRREISRAQLALTEASGQSPLFFRAPAGMRNPFLDYVLSSLGLRLATWSVRGFDTRSRNPATVSARLTRGVSAGAIVLLHDGNAALDEEGKAMIVRVLPDVLKAALDRNLEFITLREALT